MTANTKAHTLTTLIVTVGLALATTFAWLAIAPHLEQHKRGGLDKIGMLILLDQVQHKK